MSDKKYDFEIDDILAEFYADRDNAPPAAPAERAPARPEQPEQRPARIPQQVEAPAKPRPKQPVRSAAQQSPAPRQAAPAQPVQPAQSERKVSHPPAWEEMAGGSAARQVPPPERRAPAVPRQEHEEDSAPEPSRGIRFLVGTARGLLSLVFGLLALLILSWMLLNVHPDPGTQTVSNTSGSRIDLVAEFNNFSNNAASDALSGLTYIRKIYTIPENATVAPAPDPDKFHTTDDPQEVMDVIASASELLGGQSVAFDPNVEFQAGKPIRYYYDETILAIVWKEIIGGKCCTCAEVKVADGSQIRRKLADDTYGSSIQLYATAMSEQVNAVVTLSGDFYAFRNLGITVYQRQVYRCNPAQVDSCFFTASGDMLFSYAGELMEKEEAQAFVDANDVLYGVAFGPVLVDNGELRTVTSYPIGEINHTYSRTAIGMLDQLHYFCMTINYDDGYSVAANMATIGQFMYDKGCVKAYNLDGGQTSVIAVKGEPINHIDNINGQSERVVSDIIYFASALPEEEADQ